MNLRLYLRLPLLPLVFALATGCDAPGTDGDDTAGPSTESGTDPTADSGGTCAPGNGAVDVILSVDRPAAPDPEWIELSDVPCSVEADGSLSCEIDGVVESITLTLDGVGPMPWTTGDDVLFTMTHYGVLDGIVLDDTAVKVRTPQDQLLLVASVDNDPPSAATIAPLALSIDNSVCPTEPEGTLVAMNYMLGGQTLALIGNAEGSLDVDGATYHVFQEDSLTADLGESSMVFSFAMVLQP